MIPTYTRRHLSMEVCGPKYFLPFEGTPEEAFQNTVELVTNTPLYEQELYTDHLKKSAVSHEKNEIRVECHYEGYDEWYPFTIVLEVFRFNDEKEKNTGAYLMAVRMEHAYQGLLDELLDIHVFPKIVSTWKVKEYSHLVEV